MPDPVIVPRADHPISRREIDPDALRVLYRLHQGGFTAYLVGGGVRDLLLGRRPKDFDVGTDAHPHQIKRLFRNCWIIGRRFRLAHIRFGTKVVEVATFRRHVPDVGTADAPGPDESVVVASATPEQSAGDVITDPAGERTHAVPAADDAAGHAHAHRENTFGTPEEDAFRRDFTINGLFYDIETKSVIDYVGGLRDLEQRVIRSIGDPRVRFVEDPVRMMRAVVFGARLGFDLDELVVEAIAEHRQLIATASASRLIEEYYKILRSGYAEACFRALGRARLLELITPELKHPTDAVWDALARLDAYRQRFPTAPDTLTNTVLIGTLLVPIGALNRARPAERTADPRGERVSFGMLPVARKDMERLRQLQQILPRMIDPSTPARLTRTLPHRPAFPDAITWLDIAGDAPEAVERWRQVKVERPASHGHGHPHGHRAPDGHGGAAGDGHAHGAQDGQSHAPAPDGAGEGRPSGQRRRRRRRRGRRGRGGGPAPATS